MNAGFSPISRLMDHLGPKLILALVLLLALTLLAGIYTGRQSVYSALEVGPETAQSMLSELSDLREALRVARGDLEVQRTRHEVDRHALEMVRNEMAAGKERTADLEEGLSFLGFYMFHCQEGWYRSFTIATILSYNNVFQMPGTNSI